MLLKENCTSNLQLHHWTQGCHEANRHNTGNIIKNISVVHSVRSSWGIYYKASLHVCNQVLQRNSSRLLYVGIKIYQLFLYNTILQTHFRALPVMRKLFYPKLWVVCCWVPCWHFITLDASSTLNKSQICTQQFHIFISFPSPSLWPHRTPLLLWTSLQQPLQKNQEITFR